LAVVFPLRTSDENSNRTGRITRPSATLLTTSRLGGPTIRGCGEHVTEEQSLFDDGFQGVVDVRQPVEQTLWHAAPGALTVGIPRLRHRLGHSVGRRMRAGAFGGEADQVPVNEREVEIRSGRRRGRALLAAPLATLHISTSFVQDGAVPCDRHPTPGLSRLPLHHSLVSGDHDMSSRFAEEELTSILSRRWAAEPVPSIECETEMGPRFPCPYRRRSLSLWEMFIHCLIRARIHSANSSSLSPPSANRRNVMYFSC
jgi:hypothetical protein